MTHKVQEGCNLINQNFFMDLDQIFAKYNFDVHFSGHVHIYQRFPNHMLHTPNHILSNGKDSLKNDWEIFIIGSGGNFEEFEYFKT